MNAPEPGGKTSMKEAQAKKEANKIASRDQIRMVVIFNPYAEEPEEAERFGFYPETAARIFLHDKTIETIPAGGRK
jgi:hypothetical protein